MIKRILISQLAAWIGIGAAAQLSLPKVIGNNMVLQRNQKIPVWGTSKSGASVSVHFNGQQKNTTADGLGNWKLALDAMQALSVPSTMQISSDGQSITLNNILVGEVWLCSGQSNMEYTMRKNSKVTVPAGVTDWPVNELDIAHNPAIRIFLAERKKLNPDPTHSGWSIAEDSALRSFSAVGYFFAKKMYEELKVPIGVISSSIPGSRIEPWMPKEAFTALPFFQNQEDSTHKIDGDPGKFYESLIAPLAPFAIKGFLWYQGESNCFLGERIQYAYKMKALINQWRKVWGDNEMPFYYVQIAPFAYSKQKGQVAYTEESLPEFWEAQALALRIPNTGMVGTTDLNFDLDNLHPHFKWDIGKRLAICALSKTYGKKNMVAMGPMYTEMKLDGNKASLGFQYTASGLKSSDGKPLSGFEIAGADGKFVPAIAGISKDCVVVAAAGIEHPVAVRFNWNEATHPNLYNSQGLPALPFRTNNPLVAKFR
ncbi:MAG: sialate O-acetylesterase [Chitinophagaceae bacterium]